jgi:hypothetical protein
MGKEVVNDADRPAMVKLSKALSVRVVQTKQL